MDHGLGFWNQRDGRHGLNMHRTEESRAQQVHSLHGLNDNAVCGRARNPESTVPHQYQDGLIGLTLEKKTGEGCKDRADEARLQNISNHFLELQASR